MTPPRHSTAESGALVVGIELGVAPRLVAPLDRDAPVLADEDLRPDVYGPLVVLLAWTRRRGRRRGRSGSRRRRAGRTRRLEVPADGDERLVRAARRPVCRECDRLGERVVCGQAVRVAREDLDERVAFARPVRDLAADQEARVGRIRRLRRVGVRRTCRCRRRRRSPAPRRRGWP